MDSIEIELAVQDYRKYVESDDFCEDGIEKREWAIVEKAVDAFDPTLWDLLKEKLK